MPLPPYITLEDSFGEWLDATNNLTSHVDNTSAYVLVTQNATPRVSTGNVSINGTATVTTLVLQGAVTANGSNGTANQVLTTNGTGVYWANAGGGGGSATANSSGGNGAIQFYNGTNLGSSTKLIFSDDGYANKIAVGNSTANVSLHGWYTWGPALIANSANTTIILGADNDTYDVSEPDGNTGKLTNNSISLRAASGTVAIFQTVKTHNNTIVEPYGSDVGKLFRCTSNSAVTVYLPTEAGGPACSDPNLVGGTWYFFQEGTGQVTVTGYPVEGSKTTIIYGPTVTIGQYSLLSAQLVTANATHRVFVTSVSYLSTSSVTFANITTSGNVTVGNATSNGVLSGQTLLLRANTTVNTAINATTLTLSTSTANTKLSATNITTPALTVAGYTTVQGLLEKATISSTAANGTINFDTSTQGVLYYTANSANNWTVNFRGNSSTTLNAVMSTGQTLTLVFAVTNGSTAYYANNHQIDGANVTPKWQDAAAPFAGSANAIDVYVYTVIKTAASTYTMLASRTKFG